MNHKQKHTIVIGGTRGLGKVVVKILQEDGHKLSIIARNKPQFASPEQNDLNYVTADLLEPVSFLKALDEIIDTHGKIHHLVFLQRYRGEENRWSNELDMNLSATHKIIDHLQNKFDMSIGANPSIVMVSSIAGKLATPSQPLSYSVAKAGINQMMQHYAADLGQYGIRVNAVSPYTFVKEESRQFYLDNEAIYKLYQQIVPLKRMCTAEDVANVISFLCSDKSAFISGQNIIVDGGLSVLNHESLARTVSTSSC